MRTLGVGSVLVMAVAMLSGPLACSTPEAGATKADGTASSAARANEPEQLVQNMMGKAPASAAAPETSGAIPSEARASAAGVSRAKGDSLAPRAGSAETITSKHLEAELNRLEAELAN